MNCRSLSRFAIVLLEQEQLKSHKWSINTMCVYAIQVYDICGFRLHELFFTRDI